MQTLLALLIQHNQTSDRALFTSALAKHSLATESLAMHVKSIKTALRKNHKVTLEGVNGAFQHTTRASDAVISRAGTGYYDGRDGIASHTLAISPHLESTLIEERHNILPIQNLQEIPATSDENRGPENPTGTYPSHHSPDSAESSASNGKGLRLTYPMILPKNIPAGNFLVMCSYLTSKVDVVLQHAVGWLLGFLKTFLLSLPHVLVFLRLLGKVPRAVSLSLEDNIRFEDALGRMQSLQYQHFRHWAVFEARLRCTFKNTPGMQKVLQGQFVLTCPGATKEALNVTNWEKYASPGMVVMMSISISTILVPSGHCARGCVAKSMAVSDSEACCTECGLTFSITRPRQSDIIGIFKFVATRSKPVTTLVVRTRKYHRNDAPKSVEEDKRKRSESVARRLKAQLKIDRAEVANLLRYESSRKEEEERQLDVQEITLLKLVHLVEGAVLKWTWVSTDSHRPWRWAYYVELPEGRAEWQTVAFWEANSPEVIDQMVLMEERIMVGQMPGPYHMWYLAGLARFKARERALQFSQMTPSVSSLFGRTYTLTYTGSLAFNGSSLVAAKIPFIHLLVTEPLTPARICHLVPMLRGDCDKLLAIFAKDCQAEPEKKELREVSYGELDIWGFPYHNQSLRRAAIERSIQAFDILRIDRQDNLWQTLLSPEQRGKGTCLSKRHSD